VHIRWSAVVELMLAEGLRETIVAGGVARNGVDPTLLEQLKSKLGTGTSKAAATSTDGAAHQSAPLVMNVVDIAKLAVSSKPSYGAGWNVLARAMLAMGMGSTVLAKRKFTVHDCFAQALCRDPLSWSAWQCFADQMGIVGGLSDRLQLHLRALALNPSNTSLWLQLLDTPQLRPSIRRCTTLPSGQAASRQVTVPDIAVVRHREASLPCLARLPTTSALTHARRVARTDTTVQKNTIVHLPLQSADPTRYCLTRLDVVANALNLSLAELAAAQQIRHDRKRDVAKLHSLLRQVAALYACATEELSVCSADGCRLLHPCELRDGRVVVELPAPKAVTLDSEQMRALRRRKRSRQFFQDTIDAAARGMDETYYIENLHLPSHNAPSSSVGVKRASQAFSAMQPLQALGSFVGAEMVPTEPILETLPVTAASSDVEREGSSLHDAASVAVTQRNAIPIYTPGDGGVAGGAPDEANIFAAVANGRSPTTTAPLPSAAPSITYATVAVCALRAAVLGASDDVWRHLANALASTVRSAFAPTSGRGDTPEPEEASSSRNNRHHLCLLCAGSGPLKLYPNLAKLNSEIREIAGEDDQLDSGHISRLDAELRDVRYLSFGHLLPHPTAEVELLRTIEAIERVESEESSVIHPPPPRSSRVRMDPFFANNDHGHSSDTWVIALLTQKILPLWQKDTKAGIALPSELCELWHALGDELVTYRTGESVRAPRRESSATFERVPQRSLSRVFDNRQQPADDALRPSRMSGATHRGFGLDVCGAFMRPVDCYVMALRGLLSDASPSAQPPFVPHLSPADARLTSAGLAHDGLPDRRDARQRFVLWTKLGVELAALQLSGGTQRLRDDQLGYVDERRCSMEALTLYPTSRALWARLAALARADSPAPELTFAPIAPSLLRSFSALIGQGLITPENATVAFATALHALNGPTPLACFAAAIGCTTDSSGFRAPRASSVRRFRSVRTELDHHYLARGEPWSVRADDSKFDLLPPHQSQHVCASYMYSVESDETLWRDAAMALPNPWPATIDFVSHAPSITFENTFNHALKTGDASRLAALCPGVIAAVDKAECLRRCTPHRLTVLRAAVAAFDALAFEHNAKKRAHPDEHATPRGDAMASAAWVGEDWGVVELEAEDLSRWASVRDELVAAREGLLRLVENGAPPKSLPRHVRWLCTSAPRVALVTFWTASADDAPAAVRAALSSCFHAARRYPCERGASFENSPQVLRRNVLTSFTITMAALVPRVVRESASVSQAVLDPARAAEEAAIIDAALAKCGLQQVPHAISIVEADGATSYVPITADTALPWTPARCAATALLLRRFASQGWPDYDRRDVSSSNTAGSAVNEAAFVREFRGAFLEDNLDVWRHCSVAGWPPRPATHETALWFAVAQAMPLIRRTREVFPALKTLRYFLTPPQNDGGEAEEDAAATLPPAARTKHTCWSLAVQALAAWPRFEPLEAPLELLVFTAELLGGRGLLVRRNVHDVYELVALGELPATSTATSEDEPSSANTGREGAKTITPVGMLVHSFVRLHLRGGEASHGWFPSWFILTRIAALLCELLLRRRLRDMTACLASTGWLGAASGDASVFLALLEATTAGDLAKVVAARTNGSPARRNFMTSKRLATVASDGPTVGAVVRALQAALRRAYERARGHDEVVAREIAAAAAMCGVATQLDDRRARQSRFSDEDIVETCDAAASVIGGTIAAPSSLPVDDDCRPRF
jgi:hypothetical protein